MGSSLYAAGMDIDGETWLNPPSMGCDEVVESEALGPLEVTVEASQPEVLVGLSLPLTGHIIGKASHLEWSFGDGVVATNLSYFTTYTWTNTGDYTVTFTAFNTDNPGGASTNLLVHVVTLNPPALIPDGFTRSGFQLHFDGQAGATYRLLYATNLAEPITWRTQRSAFSSGGVIQFTDTAPSGDARYYRVLAQ